MRGNNNDIDNAGSLPRKGLPMRKAGMGGSRGNAANSKFFSVMSGDFGSSEDLAKAADSTIEGLSDVALSSLEKQLWNKGFKERAVLLRAHRQIRKNITESLKPTTVIFAPDKMAARLTALPEQASFFKSDDDFNNVNSVAAGFVPSFDQRFHQHLADFYLKEFSETGLPAESQEQELQWIKVQGEKYLDGLDARQNAFLEKIGESMVDRLDFSSSSLSSLKGAADEVHLAKNSKFNVGKDNLHMEIGFPLVELSSEDKTNLAFALSVGDNVQGAVEKRLTKWIGEKFFADRRNRLSAGDGKGYLSDGRDGCVVASRFYFDPEAKEAISYLVGVEGGKFVVKRSECSYKDKTGYADLDETVKVESDFDGLSDALNCFNSFVESKNEDKKFLQDFFNLGVAKSVDVKDFDTFFHNNDFKDRTF